MKKIIFTLFATLSFAQIFAQVSFTALTVKPQYPTANALINFTYNSNYSPLIRQKNMQVIVYVFTDQGLKILEPTLVGTAGIYSGSFKLDDNSTAIAFSFVAGKEKDANGTKGYIVPVYSADNKPVKGYYVAASNLQAGYGENLFGIKTDMDNSLTLLENGITAHPELKENTTFFSQYINTINRVKKKEAAPIVLKELLAFENKKLLTEQDYGMLAQMYTLNKNKAKADSFTTVMKATYPNGGWQMNAKGMAFNKEKDVAKKQALYDEFVTMYGDSEKNKTLIENFKSQLASAYLNAKNYDAYEQLSKSLPKTTVAMSKNNTAWAMAEKEEDLQRAKAMAMEATNYAKSEVLSPTEKKPDYLTNQQWIDGRKGTYAMFGDTYAYILYLLKDYKTGLPIAKDAATFNKLKDPEYNERYALLAEKAMPLAASKKLIEGFVKEGTASSKTKEALKNLYKKEKNSELGFDTYLAQLEAAANQNKIAEITKSMLNEPAPKFALKDFEGKQVSLTDLKGKVVVVDFWATWCGPCIASMPAMNTALAKYKANDKVAFIFVDTWETVDDKLQNAKEFMSKKNYPFYVLMDTENKMVEDFKVSGIPTKFILDKQGNIRFKSVGFSGNDDALVAELDTMIGLAAK